MKRIILLIFVFIFKFSFSQEIEDPRLLVGVTHFTTSGNPAAERFSGFITERVLDILNQSNRFRVVNLTSESADKDVKERAETNYKAQNWIDPLAGLNPDYTVAADITTLKFIQLTSESPQTYKASISFNLKIYNSSTKQLLGGGGSAGTIQTADAKKSLTPEGAVLQAMLTVQDDIASYFLSNFTYKTALAKVFETKGDDAKKVIILAGSSIRLSDNDIFEVYTNDYSLSKTKPLTIPIGKIKFDSDIDENYSICKVIEGGDKINQLMNQKEKVFCRLVTN